MVINPLLASGLQDCIGGAWLQGIYSDFTLEVEGTTFKCHRFILAACSEFFKCMLDSDMKESLQNSATIGDIDKHTMSTILSTLYTGVDGLNQDNIYVVWRAVHQLQISHMVKCCEDFAMKNISKENYFDVLQQAKLLKSDAVLDFVERFVVKNFEEISKTETFLELTSDELYNVLQSNELNVHNENTALESLLIWCKHNSNLDGLPKCLETGREKTCGEASSMKEDGFGKKENDSHSQSNDIMKSLEVATTEDNAVKDMKEQNDGRSKHMKKLLSAVQLYLVSPDCLQKILCHFTSMSSPDACQLLIDAIMYQLEVKRRHFAWLLSAIHRTSSDKEHVMVSLTTNNELQAYRFDSNTVCRIHPENSFNYSTIQGLCVYDNTLLISYHHHIQNDRENFTTMLTDEKQWEVVSRVYSYSSDSLLISAHGQSVYQIRDSSLERLYLETGLSKKWKYCLSLGRFFSKHARATVFRDSLIIFDPESSDQRILWVDLKTMTKTEIEGDIQDVVSFGNQKNTYIIQRDGALRKIISPNAEELSFQFVTQLWNGGWKLLGALLFRGRLFVFGKDLPHEANSQILVPSMAGVYESVEIVNINTDFPCWPMVVSKSWLKN